METSIDAYILGYHENAVRYRIHSRDNSSALSRHTSVCIPIGLSGDKVHGFKITYLTQANHAASDPCTGFQLTRK